MAAVTRQRKPDPLASRERLRDSLLDGARDELARRRWSDITMAQIARAAGVSRQTLYNEFGSREEFAQALVLREADRLLDAAKPALADHRADPSGALAAAFEGYLRAAAENPVVHAIVEEDGAGPLLALLTTHGEPLMQSAAGRLADIIRDGWPRVRAQDAELLSGCLVRLATSYAVLPNGPSGMTAHSVARLLGPYIEGLLGAADGDP